MDVFRRFRTYLFKTQRIYPISKEYCKTHLCPPPNTLTYGARGRISNFAFQPGIDAWFLLGADEREIGIDLGEQKERDRERLNLIYHGLCKDSCLQLRWRRSWLDGHGDFGSNHVNWLQGEKEILDCFVAKWNGWFRKVSVTIECSERDRTMMSRMMELAEKRSRRLVGKAREGEVKFCWTEEASVSRLKFCELNTWVKTLLVERKIWRGHCHEPCAINQ